MDPIPGNAMNDHTVPRPRRHRQERGQSMVEYAFILVLVSVVAILIVMTIGHQTGNFYSNISSGLGK